MFVPKKMIVKIHSTPNGKLIALCDSDILDKVFEEGNRQLDLSANFFKGVEVSEKELEILLKDCYIINAAGKKSIRFLIDKKFVGKENILEIKGIPTAQCIIEQ